VRLTTGEMTAWATQLYARFGEKVNWSKMARDSNYVAVTFNVQRTRNQVDPQIIINIARHYGLSRKSSARCTRHTCSRSWQIDS
jgi:hypothetical protein